MLLKWKTTELLDPQFSSKKHKNIIEQKWSEGNRIIHFLGIIIMEMRISVHSIFNHQIFHTTLTSEGYNLNNLQRYSVTHILEVRNVVQKLT